MSKIRKGRISPMKGKTWSNESRIQLSQTNKGKIHCTNGLENKFCFSEDIPYGWWRGQTNKTKSGPKSNKNRINVV